MGSDASVAAGSQIVATATFPALFPSCWAVGMVGEQSRGGVSSEAGLCALRGSPAGFWGLSKEDGVQPRQQTDGPVVLPGKMGMFLAPGNFCS